MGEVTAAIYARVSTEQQTRGNTVASQLALLRDKAQAENVRLEPDHTFIDEGYVITHPGKFEVASVWRLE